MRTLPVFLLPLLLLFPGMARAVDTDALPTGRDALESRLLTDAQDSQLDDLSLWEAALIASRVSDSRQFALRSAQFRELLQELNNRCAAEAVDARVKTVFQFLHERVLTGAYDAACSSLQSTMVDGRYNCVSATILFHVMCQHVGLRPQIVAAPGHVFSHFEIDGIGDVQTTCAEWFRAPRPVTTGAEPESRDRNSRRFLTPVQLLGKIYYNDGVALLEAGQFGDAVRALRISNQFDAGDRAARDNLLAGLNNWSLAEEDAGRLPHAAELVERGLRLEPTYAPLLANDLHIHQKWALELCDAGRYEEALELLERRHARRPDVRLFDLGRFAVVALWSESLFRGGKFEEAFRVLDGARTMLSDNGELRGYEENLLCRSVATLLRSGRREQALGLSALGLERLPGSERLQRQYRDLTQRSL